jgi:hypothetical protein
MMDQPFKPRWARHRSRRDQWRFFLIGLGTVYEGLVIALSLGWLTINTRAWLLFDLFDDD